MSLDWNWFFSAFAQCSAALIGIISAFIISKLLGENDKYEAIAGRLDSLVIKKNDLCKRVSNRNFDWYDRLNIEYESDLERAITQGAFANLTEEQKLERLFDLLPHLCRVEGCIDYLNAKIEELSGQSPRDLNLRALTHRPPDDIWDELSRERETIQNLQIECETLIDKLKSVLRDFETTRRNLKPIRNTIYILSAGLLFTVIYPLHFMPLPINESPFIDFSMKILLSNLLSMKGGLLVILTITIESILIYFLFITNSLKSKYSKSIESVDDSWLDIKHYSKYFRSVIDSEKRV